MMETSELCAAVGFLNQYEKMLIAALGGKNGNIYEEAQKLVEEHWDAYENEGWSDPSITHCLKTALETLKKE